MKHRIDHLGVAIAAVSLLVCLTIEVLLILSAPVGAMVVWGVFSVLIALMWAGVLRDI